MRIFSLTILILFGFVLINFGQAKTKKSVLPNYPTLQIQAEEMVKAFETRNYQTFANYIYPSLIEKFGGREEFIEFTEKSMAELKTTDAVIEEYRILKTIQILRQPKNIFAVMQTRMKMKMSGKPMSIVSSLVGVSDDKGENWKFITVNSKDMIKPFFPQMVNKLKILPDKIS